MAATFAVAASLTGADAGPGAVAPLGAAPGCVAPPELAPGVVTPPDGAAVVEETLEAAALARIGYPWAERLGGWTLEFLPGRPGYLGATWSEAKRIEIYVREGLSVEELAFTIAHELGHAVDLTYLGPDDRDAWLVARGVAGTDWWTTSGASDYAVGAGDWAEAFAVWQVGGASESTLAGQPTPAQLDLIARQATGR